MNGNESEGIAKLVMQVTNVDISGVDNRQLSFSDIGGDSISAVRSEISRENF